MDSTDCWISEFDFKTLTLPSSTGFASPGPSSGYCSSEESHNQLKAINGGQDSKSAVFQQRQSEPFWRSDAFNGSSALEVVSSGTGSDLIGMEDTAFDFGTSPPNFDDLMDTFWNPIKLDFPSMDSVADFDMTDMSQSSAILGVSSNRSDPGLARLGNTATMAQQSSSLKSGWQKRAASPSKEEPSLVKKPSNPSISSCNTISAESRNRLKRVFDFQQQVAGLVDMTVGDEEEYILQFSVGNNNKTANRVAESTATSSTATMVAPTAAQGSALLSGVFSQRGNVPASFKNCETKALARVRGGAVATSCGTLLRHSVSMPSNVKSAADGTGAQRSSGSRLQNSVLAQRSCARGDMKGGRANASVLALDDHRYTLKPTHSPPVPRSSRGRKSSTATASNSSTSTQSAPFSGKMSILEAFLRSTRPLDPNKGSNAALAAEGLAHLRIETDDDEDSKSSGTILKKLLTGEIDQSEVHRCEQQVIQDRVNSLSALADPVLADDFGLGAELLLDDSEANNLLCGDLASSGLWLNAENNDEILSSELDEILREQTRQDDLWLRHYINCL